MKLLSYFLLFIGPWLGAQTATETALPKIRFADDIAKFVAQEKACPLNTSDAAAE